MADPRRGEDGSVEIAIVFPVAMLAILLVIQAGLWYLGRTVAADAARDGARAAALASGTSTSGQARAEDDLHQLGGAVLRSATVVVDRNAQRAQVLVTGRAESILPWLSLPVTAAAGSPVESFRP